MTDRPAAEDPTADEPTADEPTAIEPTTDPAADPAPSPRPRLRPAAGQPTGPRPAGRGDAPPSGPGRRPSPRPDARPPAAEPGPSRPEGRAVPVRVVLAVGLAVLLLLAVGAPGGPAAVVGVPLALLLPGAVLQPRYLPGLGTDAATRWCLRVALSLAAWALVGLGVGAAGIPVRSVWPVVVADVLLAAVVVGEPAGERRYGWLRPRSAGWVAAGLLVAVLLAFGGRALVAVGGGTAGPTGTAGVTVAFADPTTPFALTATGARATARVVVTNPGTATVRLALTGAVGRGLPWTPVTADVPAGGTRTVEVTGVVPVCSDPQQAVVAVSGAGDLAPLATVLAGTDGAPRCGTA